MNIAHGLPVTVLLSWLVLPALLPVATVEAKCFCANGYGGCACGDIECCKRSMGIVSPGPAPSSPGFNHEAERQRQQAEVAERERVRQAEEQRKQEQAEREAKFVRERDAAASTLKGFSGSGAPELQGGSGTNSYGLKGVDSSAGGQLKTVEQHSRRAAGLRKESSSAEARQGFDTPGKGAGPLVYPNISGKKPAAPSALAAKVPAAAQKDVEVKSALAWYDQLDKVKAETKQKIADAREQQKSGGGDKAALSAHIQSLTNQLQDAEKQQAKTEEKVKARVKNLGFAWNEAPAPDTGMKK